MLSFAAFGKMIVGTIWAWCLFSLGNPASEHGPLAFSIVKTLTLVHLVECALFTPAIRALNKPLLPNLALVFVFGVFQLWALRAEAEVDGNGDGGASTAGG